MSDQGPLFKVRVSRVFTNEDRNEHLTMETTINLPFVPTARIVLGFFEYSDCDTDRCIIKRVMWNVALGMFIAELNLSTGGMKAAKDYAKMGWTLRMYPMTTRDDAEGCCEDGDTVIEIDGEFHAMRPCELEMLEFIRNLGTKTTES